MAKKTVRLTPQERFDLIDALALQQGPMDYISQVIGNLMGASSGLLTFAPFGEIDGDTLHLGAKRFAFYVSSGSYNDIDGQLQETSDQDRLGDVVVYDPSSSHQVATSVSFQPARLAYEAYAVDNVQNGVDQNTGLELLSGTEGAEATPFLWARGVPRPGQEDARRKWSIAQQVEVPVTMSTRVLTEVEFRFSRTMPATLFNRDEEIGGGELHIKWAPIARIIDFDGNIPVITPISAFDSKEWEDRLKDKYDLDPTGSTFLDWYSGESPSLTSKEFFGNYARPMGPAISPMVSLLTSLSSTENVNILEGNQGLKAQLELVADEISSRPAADSSRDKFRHLGHDFRKLQNFSCWNKSKVNGSVGIVDQLAGIKAVIQAITGSGIFEYGGDLVLDERTAPFRNNDPSLQTLWEALSENKKSGWNAKPIRSVNSLALENMLQKEELENLRTELDALKTEFDALENDHEDRITALENQDDPFSSVPINDAQPLVPALAFAFQAKYGVSATSFDYHSGPQGAISGVGVFVYANTYSKIQYARGCVRITLSEECIESMGGQSALTDGQVVIHATPLHYTNRAPWLYPEDTPFGVGAIRGDDGIVGDDVGGTISGRENGESVVKYHRIQVLNAFANFYQCTLNVVIFPETRTLHVYPVNTVPDIIEKGHDLRGYPAFGGWARRVSTDSDGHSIGVQQINRSPFTQNMHEMYVDNELTGQYAGDAGIAYAWLHGDVTNPDIYRDRNGGSDVNDGNYVKEGLGKDHVFGHADDLRGAAQSVTFLRPDRFSRGASNRRIAAPDYDARHNVPRTTVIDMGSDDRHAQNFVNEQTGEKFKDGNGNDVTVVGRNGRFIPSFSLTIFKNTFSALGSDEPLTRIPVQNFDLDYNHGNVMNSEGVVSESGNNSSRGGS